jgi:hypothetical protein
VLCFIVVPLSPAKTPFAVPLNNYKIIISSADNAVAWLVEALCYKPENRGSIPGEVIGFSIDLILSTALSLWGRLSL